MSARRAGIVAASLAMLVALAGCGGIPSSGSVQTGQFIDPEKRIDVGFAPGGPQAGADQLTILQGFINAATDPSDDYGVARLFLSEDIRDSWKPNATTQIRTGSAQARTDSETSGSYTLTSSAHVNEFGQYVEDDPTTQVLPFSFAQDDEGEWRISSAPQGTVLSRAGFDSIFDAHPLYFFDPTNKYLIPDLRWFPRTNLLATTVVRALLAGQSSWLQQGVTTTYFPEGTTLDSSVSVESNVATVALSKEANGATPEQVERMRQQLRDTIGGVSSVVITVNSIPLAESAQVESAVINPGVKSQSLVRKDDEVGYLSNAGSVSGLGGQSAELVALGATDFTLSSDSSRSAVLTPDGAYLVFTGDTDALRVDARPGLLAPAIDSSGYVWTVQGGNAASIQVHDQDGGHFTVNAPDLAGVRAVSFAVSRDGARALILTSSELGAQLFVSGIIRTDGVPTQLAAPIQLRLPSSSRPLDATWVDDNSVATLTVLAGEDVSTVTLFEIGGPSQTLGSVDGGVSIVGGNGGFDGLRVLTKDGAIYRSRGNGWADLGTKVTFIATQQ